MTQERPSGSSSNFGMETDKNEHSFLSNYKSFPPPSFEDLTPHRPSVSPPSSDACLSSSPSLPSSPLQDADSSSSPSAAAAAGSSSQPASPDTPPSGSTQDQSNADTETETETHADANTDADVDVDADSNTGATHFFPMGLAPPIALHYWTVGLSPSIVLRYRTYQYPVFWCRHDIYVHDERLIFPSIEGPFQELGNLRTYGERMWERARLSADVGDGGID